MFCWSCSGGLEGHSPRRIIHEFKTLHLNIDAVGDVVVAEGIYDLMKRNGLVGELKAMKHISKPEPIRLEMGTFEAPLTFSREKGPLNGEFRG